MRLLILTLLFALTPIAVAAQPPPPDWQIEQVGENLLLRTSGWTPLMLASKRPDMHLVKLPRGLTKGYRTARVTLSLKGPRTPGLRLEHLPKVNWLEHQTIPDFRPDVLTRHRSLRLFSNETTSIHEETAVIASGTAETGLYGGDVTLQLIFARWPPQGGSYYCVVYLLK